MRFACIHSQIHILCSVSARMRWKWAEIEPNNKCELCSCNCGSHHFLLLHFENTINILIFSLAFRLHRVFFASFATSSSFLFMFTKSSAVCSQQSCGYEVYCVIQRDIQNWSPLTIFFMEFQFRKTNRMCECITAPDVWYEWNVPVFRPGTPAFPHLCYDKNPTHTRTKRMENNQMGKRTARLDKKSILNTCTLHAIIRITITDTQHKSFNVSDSMNMETSRRFSSECIFRSLRWEVELKCGLWAYVLKCSKFVLIARER